MRIPTPVNYRIYLDGIQQFAMSIELPELEPLMGEIRGLRISGTFAPYQGAYDAIEMTATFNAIDNDPTMAKFQFDPQNPSQLQVRANQFTYTPGAPPIPGTFLFMASVRSIGHSGGEMNVEDTLETEITLTVDRLTYTINGAEVFHLDVLGSEGARVNGVPLIANN